MKNVIVKIVKMKKVYFMLLLLVLLTACFGEEATDDMPILDGELEEGELTILTLATSGNFMREYSDAFREKYPQIKINIITQSDIYDLDLDKLIAEHKPDIVEIYPFYMHFYKDLFMDLNEYIEFEHIDIHDFYPSLIEGSSIEGELKGIPYIYSIPLFYYEKRVFNEAGIPHPESGWTWEEAIDILNRLDNDHNLVLVFDTIEPLIHSLGKSYLSGEDFSAAGNLNDPLFVSKMESVYEALKNTIRFQEYEGTNDIYFGPSIHNTSRDTRFETGLVGAAGVPYFSEDDRVTSMSMSSLAIRKDAENIDAAWQFLKESFIEDNELSQMLARERYFSTRKSVSASSGFDQLDMGKVILDELHYAKQSIATLGPHYPYHILVNYINNHDSGIPDFENLQQQLDDMAERWDKELSQFINRAIE